MKYTNSSVTEYNNFAQFILFCFSGEWSSSSHLVITQHQS